MKRLILARTRHDIGNQYLFAYSEEIINEAKNYDWTVNAVENEKNNQKEICSRIEKNKPDLIIFNEHGNADCIYGYKDERLIDANSVYLLAAAIVFARSCSALKELGKKAINKNCTAFIGYNSEFYIPHIHEFEATPLKDPTAKPVLEISNIIAKQLLKGTSVKIAVAAAKNKANELILRMLASEEPYDAAAFKALIYNHWALGFEGDPNAMC